MEHDFGGWATKANIKCTDGRTIMPNAFQHQHSESVPLVWAHDRSGPDNILGHAILENREEGVYVKAYFNETRQGQSAKALVQHRDIKSLSIFANQLVERSKNVIHGMIREVSLVLAGANPGALIDYVNLAHADGTVEKLDDEAVIYMDQPLELEHAAATPTVQEIYDSLTPEQKDVVSYMIGAALEDARATHSDDDGDDSSAAKEGKPNKEINHGKDDDDPSAAKEGKPNKEINHGKDDATMGRNVFETNGTGEASSNNRPSLTHDQLKAIFSTAEQTGSFKTAFLQHAVTYGIENIDYLFPEAKTLTNQPEFVSRRMEWVNVVLSGVRRNPFSRIKSMYADITADDARAKGYIKGSLKKEEFFALAKRETTPTTVYKKQKLDRDDIIDITDLDVVMWIKGEMRLMLDEELARAILVGDGREIDDDDKVNESCIRPVAHDDTFYAHQDTVAANISTADLIKRILRVRVEYRGSGNPTMFTTEDLLTDMLLVEDKMGRRKYETEAALAAALRVSRIVTVPVMEDVTTTGGDLLCIMLNLSDYTIGADRGGQVSMFDDFDIDYNQYKYLLEGRMSGCLTKYKSAVVITRDAGTLVSTVTAPTFVTSTGVVTIPSVTGVEYYMDDVLVSAGDQTAIDPGASTTIVAQPATGYYFAHNIDTDWTFTRDAA